MSDRKISPCLFLEVKAVCSRVLFSRFIFAALITRTAVKRDKKSVFDSHSLISTWRLKLVSLALRCSRASGLALFMDPGLCKQSKVLPPPLSLSPSPNPDIHRSVLSCWLSLWHQTNLQATSLICHTRPTWLCCFCCRSAILWMWH